MEPLRCHLLIGPPASGKSTTAEALAPLLAGPEGQPAVVLSTDAIRAEVFGDSAVQGPWPSIQQRLHERLIGAVGRWIYYRLQGEAIEQLRGWLGELASSCTTTAIPCS